MSQKWNQTVSLDDMRLFASVAKEGSITAAAAELRASKQTVSRRLAVLEEALGVQLVRRTTRVLTLTDVGEAYAERCSELVELAESATRAVTAQQDDPAGTLRVTADPHFGEAFLGPLLVEYAQRWPEAAVELVLTRRRVDLVAEGFDVAFRVGDVGDATLTTTRLGPARIRYCASPDYVRRRGEPKGPDDLRQHDCVLVVHEGRSNRWPFRTQGGVRTRSVDGRLRFTSFEIAHQAIVAGLGIGIYPEYACHAALRDGLLTTVLDDHVIDVGGVNIVTPTQRFLSARIRAFVDLARTSLSHAPWQHESREN